MLVASEEHMVIVSPMTSPRLCVSPVFYATSRSVQAISMEARHRNIRKLHCRETSSTIWRIES